MIEFQHQNLDMIYDQSKSRCVPFSFFSYVIIDFLKHIKLIITSKKLGWTKRFDYMYVTQSLSQVTLKSSLPPQMIVTMTSTLLLVDHSSEWHSASGQHFYTFQHDMIWPLINFEIKSWSCIYMYVYILKCVMSTINAWPLMTSWSYTCMHHHFSSCHEHLLFVIFY